MSPKELLEHCARAMNPEYPALQCITLVFPSGSGRFPFSGKGVELLNEMPGRRVYSVDIEVVLTWVAKQLKAARKEALEQYEREQQA